MLGSLVVSVDGEGSSRVATGHLKQTPLLPGVRKTLDVRVAVQDELALGVGWEGEEIDVSTVCSVFPPTQPLLATTWTMLAPGSHNVWTLFTYCPNVD